MMNRVEKIIEVVAPPEDVFRVLSDYESYPRWMHNIVAVHRLADHTLEWQGIAHAEANEKQLRWTTETTIHEPDHRIVWRSINGDVVADCETLLQETRAGTTLVRVVRGFEVRDEQLPAPEHTALAEYQSLRLEEDLARLKQLIESRLHAPVAQQKLAASASFNRDLEAGSARHDVNDVSEVDKVFRRGVDRLLDEPPSRDWQSK